MAFLLALWAAPAVGATCPPKPKTVKVTVDSHFAQPRYDHSRSLAEIGTLSGKPAAIGFITSGFTRGVYSTGYSFSFESAPRKGGGACVTLKEVKGRINYESLTVFVARDYKKGSCQYKVVLDHEMEHVAIFRKVFNKHVPRIRRKMEVVARSMRPFWVSRVERAGKEMEKRLNAALKPLVNAMEREKVKKNAAIDTETNYRKITARCRKW